MSGPQGHSSILTDFKIPKKPRVICDDSYDKVVGTSSSGDNIISVHPSTSSTLLPIDATSLVTSKMDNSAVISLEKKVVETVSNSSVSRELPRYDHNKNMSSPNHARRRINLAEYMSSKSHRGRNAIDSSVSLPSSLIGSNDKKNEQDETTINHKNKDQITCKDAFYTDTLASLRFVTNLNSDGADTTACGDRQSITKEQFDCNSKIENSVPDKSNDSCEDCDMLTSKSADDNTEQQQANFSLFSDSLSFLDNSAGSSAVDSTKSSLDQELTSSNNSSFTSILSRPGKQRTSKKSVSWADEGGNDLEAVRIFKSDRDEGVGCNYDRVSLNIGMFNEPVERDIRRFPNMMGFNKFNDEKDVFFASQSLHHNKHRATSAYGPLIKVFIPNHIQRRPINSVELKVQAEREKKVLQDIFLPCVSIPKSPAEPDPSTNDQDERQGPSTLDRDFHGLVFEPKIIPTSEIVCEDEEMPLSSISVTELSQMTHSSDVQAQSAISNSICSAVPPSLRPELAELLARAHQQLGPSTLNQTMNLQLTSTSPSAPTISTNKETHDPTNDNKPSESLQCGSLRNLFDELKMALDSHSGWTSHNNQDVHKTCEPCASSEIGVKLISTESIKRTESLPLKLENHIGLNSKVSNTCNSNPKINTDLTQPPSNTVFTNSQSTDFIASSCPEKISEAVKITSAHLGGRTLNTETSQVCEDKGFRIGPNTIMENNMVTVAALENFPLDNPPQMNQTVSHTQDSVPVATSFNVQRQVHAGNIQLNSLGPIRGQRSHWNSTINRSRPYYPRVSMFHQSHIPHSRAVNPSQRMPAGNIRISVPNGGHPWMPTRSNRANDNVFRNKSSFSRPRIQRPPNSRFIPRNTTRGFRPGSNLFHPPTHLHSSPSRHPSFKATSRSDCCNLNPIQCRHPTRYENIGAPIRPSLEQQTMDSCKGDYSQPNNISSRSSDKSDKFSCQGRTITPSSSSNERKSETLGGEWL